MFKRIDLDQNEYPPLLRQIHKPPEVLFVRGNLPAETKPTIAVVGSRKCSEYGKKAARMITTDLVNAGVVIVSGLAFGIDEVAHEATIEAGGITIAVLASGVDEITPTQQKPLAENILNHNGAIVSQFPEGTQPLKHFFPIRNHVISGLSLGTLVVEATEKSGALITARAALEQGRDVFAVPGPIDSETSKGTNALLRSGAHLVACAQDILDVLGLQGVSIKESPQEQPTADSPEEAALLPHLSKNPVHVDLLVRESGLKTSVVNTTLTLMEMKGKIRHAGGNHYILG